MILEYLWELIPATVKPRFIGDIPSASDEGISLTVEGSTEIARYFQPACRLVSQTVVCNIRTKKYTTGNKFLQLVKQSLDSKKDEEKGILSVTLQTSDDYLGINEEKLHEFQVLFKAIVKEDI